MGRKSQYYLYHTLNTTPSCVVFYLSCSVVTWKRHKCLDWLSVYTDTWGVVFDHSQAPRSVFVIDLLYYLSSLDVSQVDIEIWVKAAADGNNGAC